MPDDNQANADQAKSGTQGAAGDQTTAGARTGADLNQPISAEIRTLLKSVLEHNAKTLRSELLGAMGESRKEVDDLKTKLQDLFERFDGKNTDDGQKAGQEPPKKSAAQGEILELRKRLEAAENAWKAETKKREEAEEREKASDFKRKVVDSLTRAGCLTPDLTFKAIRDDFTYHPDSGEVTAEYADAELGQTLELTADQYIEQVVREKKLPQLFSATARAGAQVGGSRDKGQKYEISYKQWSDPAYYVKNQQLIFEKALEGKVEPKPGEERFSP